MREIKFKSGDVVTYTPLSVWCRHGIAIVTVNDPTNPFANYAYDTYYGSESTAGGLGWMTLDRLDPANIIANTHEFGEIPYPHEYDDFRSEDKYFIPKGTRSSYQRIRIGAVPDLELQEKRLRYQVEKAEANIKIAENSLRYQIQEYEKIVGKSYISAKDTL